MSFGLNACGIIRRSICGCGVSLMTLGMMAATAKAETAPIQQVATPAASSQGLEEIVVTAQRHAEREKDVPVSVSALKSQELNTLSAGGPDIRFLSAKVPSLQIESSFGRTFPRFYIRGLGNSDFDLNASQPVSIIYDDVAMSNPILKAFPIFDADQVEVLRGPQGTLFGQGTPAGVVKIDSKKPTDSFEGYGDLSYGRFNAVDFTGAVGGPIVPGKLDFRASLLVERQDDWVSNTYPNAPRPALEGFVDTAGRFQLKFTPTDDFTALWNVHFRETDGTARVFRANAIQLGTNNLAPNFDVYSVDQNAENFLRLHTIGSVLDLSDNLGPVTVTSITGYERGYSNSRGDIDGGSLTDPAIPFQSDTSDEIPLLNQISEEARYTSNDWGRWFNQGGFFYLNETVHITDFDYTTAGDPDGVAYQKQDTQSYGLYESGKYQITPDWSAGAGVRWSEDDKQYTVNRTLSPLGFLVPVLGPIYGPLQLGTSPSASNVSWDVSTTYALNSDVNLYARVARGFRGPAIQGRILFANVISQASAERTISYEAGLKGTFLGNKLRFNIDGFDYTDRNTQLTAVGGGANANILVNAKKVEGYGFEADAQFKPIPALLLSAGASYNHTQIDDPNLSIAACASVPSCTLLNPVNAQGLALINGNPLPQAPAWIVDWEARYTMPVDDSSDVYLDTDWSYRSSVDFFLYKAAEFDGPPQVIGGARLGYVNHDQGWEAALFMRNITNEVDAIGGIDFDNLTGMVNDPRTYGAEVSYHF